jgi:hypothetical protein
LPKGEKPFSAQGQTHVESSNAAAQSALKYLASKFIVGANDNNNSKIIVADSAYAVVVSVESEKDSTNHQMIEQLKDENDS